MRISRRKLINTLLVLLTVLTLVFIFSNSMLDKQESSDLSMKILNMLRPILRMLGIEAESDHVLRKIAHFAEFMSLGTELVCLLYLNKGFIFQMAVNAAFCGLVCAVTDEFIQVFSARGSQVQDVVLDFAGVVFGILLVSPLVFLLRKKEKALCQ